MTFTNINMSPSPSTAWSATIAMAFSGFAVTETGMTDFLQQGTAFPSQGVMTVTATDRTSLTFTVQNTTTTQIAVDTNGDGSIDQTMTRTWSELASLI